MDTELTEEQYQRMVYTVGDIDKTIHFMRQYESSHSPFFFLSFLLSFCLEWRRAAT